METPGWYKTYAGRGGPTLRANPALHVQGTTARILPPNASGTAGVISAPTKSEKSGVSFSVVSRAIPDADGPPYDGVTAMAEKRSAQKRRGTSNCFMSPFYRTAPITQTRRPAAAGRRVCGHFQLLTSRFQILFSKRIPRATDFKMEVRTGGASRGADIAHNLPLLRGRPLGDNDVGERRVERLRAVVGGDDNILPVPAVPAVCAAYDCRSVRR